MRKVFLEIIEALYNALRFLSKCLLYMFILAYCALIASMFYAISIALLSDTGWAVLIVVDRLAYWCCILYFILLVIWLFSRNRSFCFFCTISIPMVFVLLVLFCGNWINDLNLFLSK